MDDAGSLVGKSLGQLGSLLSPLIGDALKKTWFFESELTKIQNTIDDINPFLNQIEELNEKLNRRDETEKFRDKLIEVDAFIKKCECVHLWEVHLKVYYAYESDDLNESLKNFFQFYVSMLKLREGKEILVTVNDMKKNMEKAAGSSSGVPLPKGIVIGFEDRVRALKGMVLKDPVNDDCSVILVSAAGGCGKTTLVTMLCHDPDIKEKFGENVYFVTISSTPNIKAVISGLLEKKLDGHQQRHFNSNEDATRQWGSFLEINNSPVLLVLDDVWSHSIVKQFEFKFSGYKILVTSRTAFTQVDNIYPLKLLNPKDATTLFRRSAFSEPRTDITDELVDKLVECCKNHPLVLTVIGGLLKGTPIEIWNVMFKDLSEGKKSVFDVDDDSILVCLERSLGQFYREPEIKQCYLDLGLFPEDQKIAATALKDMWVHLYKHDEEGSRALTNLSKISYKNLATLLPISKNSPDIVNPCEEISVMQHDVLRTLAIHLSSKEPVEHRERLIINPNERDLSQLPHTVNARLLSMSTDETSYLRWNNIQFPKVEVFVLNFISTTHPLPQFMHDLESLKVLIITNYGYNITELENFPAPQNLSGLTRIRLDHVKISLLSTSILELGNLQKLSLIMCKIGNSFNEETVGIHNKLTSLLEINIDSCDDLVTFPAILCNLVSLRKLSITNCHELTSLSEEFGNLTNLEVLRLASCSKLAELPESIINLNKLSIIDLSYCLSLCKLPVDIGQLVGLQTIDVTCCTGLHELPESVKNLHPLKVICDEEISHLWSDLNNVEVKVVEEDRLRSLSMIIPRGFEC